MITTDEIDLPMEAYNIFPDMNSEYFYVSGCTINECFILILEIFDP